MKFEMTDEQSSIAIVGLCKLYQWLFVEPGNGKELAEIMEVCDLLIKQRNAQRGRIIDDEFKRVPA